MIIGKIMFKKIANLIFEALHLKRIKHEWFRFAWIQNPDSVAEHSLVAAQIWYILAKMNWADANKVAAILIWHDFAEVRLWDLHKIATKYVANKDKIEREILEDQLKDFDFKDDIIAMFEEYEYWTSQEWLIAHDADLLEQAFQSKEYVDNWFVKTQDWIDNVWKGLRTKVAKDLFEQIWQTSFTEWWEKNKLKQLDNGE